MAGKAVEHLAWDSTVTIDCVGKVIGRYCWIEPLITRAEAGEVLVVVSTMAIAETIKIDGEEAADAKVTIGHFFDQRYVVPVAAGRNVAEVAAEVRRAHKVAGADSLHIATALITKTPILLTNDGVNPTAKKQPLLPLDNLINFDGMTLRIMTPEQYHALQVAKANPIFQAPPPLEVQEAAPAEPFVDEKKAETNGAEHHARDTSDTDTVSEVRISDTASASDAETGDTGQPAKEVSGDTEAQKA